MAKPGSENVYEINNQLLDMDNTANENIITPENEDNQYQQSPVKEIEIMASQIVNRLEKAAEENATTGTSPRIRNNPRTSLVSSVLGPEKRSTEQIINLIEDLIVGEAEENEYALPGPLDESAKVALVSHSIGAYASSLDRQHLQKLSARMTAETTRWLSHMFRFWECAAFHHEDPLEGLVRITRMALHHHYPRYLDEGWTALAAAPPTLYGGAYSPLSALQHLCRQLGLPLACIRPVPCNTMFGSQHTMDISALQRMLSEDVAAGRTPLLVLADAGAPITGHVDSLQRLVELCRTHDAWLHVQGHALASLTLNTAVVGTTGLNASHAGIADSFTLHLGIWLDVPGLPMVTLYRLYESSVARTPIAGGRPQVSVPRESTLPLLAGLGGSEIGRGRKVASLPIWATLQVLGRDEIQSRINKAFYSVELIWKEVSQYKNIRILSPTPGGEGQIYSINDVSTRSATLLLETAASCLVFQFVPDVNEGEILHRVPAYYDKLNSWLGQVLQRDVPQIPIQICELENSGFVLRFCPLEGGCFGTVDIDTMVADIESFSQFLGQQLDIMIATVHHKQTFKALVDASPVLKLVDVPDWAGLGGVRYSPEGWEQLLTDQAKEELNRLNISLVDQLRSTDGAFSLGEGSDSLACVRFGLVTDDTDLEALLSLVISVGRSVEENERVFDSMSEIVKKGIETATQDLQKENEDRLWQEGILRQVPIVGTFVNWWSPRNKETGVRGRSLNLTQGVVESTENIYRYHMQLQGGQTTPGVSKAPPQPLVQTQVGGHSRSSSHSSGVSSNVNNIVSGSHSNSNMIASNLNNFVVPNVTNLQETSIGSGVNIESTSNMINTESSSTNLNNNTKSLPQTATENHALAEIIS